MARNDGKVAAHRSFVYVEMTYRMQGLDMEPELLEKLADPLDKSPVWLDDKQLRSASAAYSYANGFADMMVGSAEIELHYGRRNYQAWRELQDKAETSYAVRTVGHFSVDSYQPACDYGHVIAQFSGEWLDVGCGKLDRPAYMKEASEISFFGIDPMDIPTEREFPFVRALGDFLPFKDGVFDGLMFSSSLDHCIVPLQALEEARRVLRPGGTLLVWETIRPDDRNFKDWASTAIYFQSRYNAHHNWGFTRETLEFVVHKAGFEVLRWEETSDPREVVLVASA